MNNLKIVNTKDLYLYISDGEFIFGELANQDEPLFVGIDRSKFYIPSKEQLNSYMSPNENDIRVISLKKAYEGRGNAAIQLMFSGNENLLLQKVYEADFLLADTLNNIERHLHASFKGRRLANQGMLKIQEDINRLNSEIDKANKFKATLEDEGENE